MTLAQAIKEQLADSNPDALYPDGLDQALIGIARRCGQPDLAAYDANTIINILAHDMSQAEAEEFYETNIVGAWVGPNTPIYLDTNFLPWQPEQMPKSSGLVRPDER